MTNLVMVEEAAETQKRAQDAVILSAQMQRQRLSAATERLVAEASGDGDLVAAFGAATAEDSCSGLGGHANEKAVDLATAATVGLEGALGHRDIPVRKSVCLRRNAEDIDLGSKGRPAERVMRMQALPETHGRGLQTPAEQQVLSIAELRKTGNEIRRTTCQSSKRDRSCRGWVRFFTRFGATLKFFVRLHEMAMQKVPIRVIVSGSFRNGRWPCGESFSKEKESL
jgi:hypothetical protein